MAEYSALSLSLSLSGLGPSVCLSVAYVKSSRTVTDRCSDAPMPEARTFLTLNGRKDTAAQLGHPQNHSLFIPIFGPDDDYSCQNLSNIGQYSTNRL